MNIQSAPQGNNIQIGGLNGGLEAQCPACLNGSLIDSFTPCGLCLAVCCFPVGLLCCWLLREKQCNACGAKPVSIRPHTVAVPAPNATATAGKQLTSIDNGNDDDLKA